MQAWSSRGGGALEHDETGLLVFIPDGALVRLQERESLNIMSCKDLLQNRNCRICVQLRRGSGQRQESTGQRAGECVIAEMTVAAYLSSLRYTVYVVSDH